MKVHAIAPRGENILDSVQKVILEAEDDFERRALAFLICDCNPSDEICTLLLESLSAGAEEGRKP